MARKRVTFETRMERLREIVESLERDDLPLEEGVKLYKEGVKLSSECGKQLEDARHEVKIVSEGLAERFESLEDTGADDVD